MQPSYSYFSLQITNAILRLPLYIFARKVLKFMLFGGVVDGGEWMGWESGWDGRVDGGVERT